MTQAQYQVSDELKAAFELALRNRGISRAMSKWNLPAQVVGASLAVAWPLGAALGTVGIVGMVSTAGVIAIVGFVNGKRESDAIAAGDAVALEKYLNPDDVLEFKQIKQRLLEGGKSSKKMSPNQGQNQPNQKTSSSSTGTTTNSDGSESASIPQAIAQLDDAAPHLFMVGKTREGKSETLKHLIGSEKRVWYLTSKATDQVPSHWQGYRVGGPLLVKQITWLLDQWESSFLLHLEGVDTNREWFVIDEAVGILQSLKTKGAKGTAERLRGFIVEGITAGAAVNAMVGILSQTGNSGPIGIDLDLLQNFSCVACGKKKKPKMIDAFTKLTGLRFTPEQEQEILSLKGYWQLWENDGPCLSQVPLSNLPLKAVEVCPVPDEDEDAIANQRTDIKPPQVKARTMEDRIISYLLRQGEAKTIRDIINNATWQTGKPRPSTDQVKDVLAYLASEGKVQIKNDDSKALYRATVT